MSRSAWSARLLVVAATALLTVAALRLGPFARNQLLTVEIFVFAVTVAWTVRRETRRNGDALTVFNLASAYYLATFAFGAIHYANSIPEMQRFHYDKPDVEVSVVFGYASWLLFSVGYYAVRRKQPNHDAVRATTYPPLSPIALIAIAIVGWLARIELYRSGRYFHIADQGSELTATSSSFLISTLAGLPLLVLVVVILSAARPLRPATRLLVSGLFLVELTWALPTGARADVIVLLVTVVAAYYYSTRRMPTLRLSLAGAAVVLVVFPAIAQYRGHDASYRRDVTTQGSTALKETLSSPDLVVRGMDSVLARFADGLSAAVVLQQGPSPVPGYGATGTAQLFLTAPVPRVLLPHKPDPGLYGNAFGRAYGFVSPQDHVTSINVSHPLGLLLDFGVLGVLIGMPIVGVGFRVVETTFRRRGEHLGVTVVYVMVLWVLATSPGTTPALGLLGALKNALVYAAFLHGARLLTPTSSATSRSGAP